jgi:PAT family beta-lactamase induction signal transducer AmpG
VTAIAPRSEYDRTEPPRSLRAAVWEPFVGFLAVDRALELLAFVVLYKLADNLALALIRPFLVEMGYNDFDVGIATASIGLAATLIGTFLGGMLTTGIGLGHALWAFGVLQILASLGYVWVAGVGVNRPLMYGAMGFESLTTGMGTGAFSVLLLRMTQKRFSATQYALFSSLFALPRLLAGPVTGVMVDAIGWRDFFLFTMAAGIPGMIMLHRFSPLGAREPRVSSDLSMSEKHASRTVGRAGLIIRAATGGAIGLATGALAASLIRALKMLHKEPQAGLDLLTPLATLFAPRNLSSWVELAGVMLFALIVALTTAAAVAARSRKGN